MHTMSNNMSILYTLAYLQNFRDKTITSPDLILVELKWSKFANKIISMIPFERISISKIDKRDKRLTHA